MRSVSRALLAALALVACESTPPALDAGTDAGRDAGPRFPPVVVREETREPCAARDPLRRPLFGDLHVHTALSFDAAAYDVRTRPADAYRFARGEEIGLPPYDAEGRPTRTLRLSRPLDFAAVTDHSEFLAETTICNDPTSPGYGSATCTTYREERGRAGNYGEITASLASGQRDRLCTRVDPALCESVLLSAWGETQEAAEEAYDRSSACSFTSFVAWEWSATYVGNNLHRNVIFRSATAPRTPISFFEAPTPDQLWDGLEASCLDYRAEDGSAPCDVLAIPHNSNLGAGSMFVPERDDGSPYDRAFAERRAALEPIVELYQHKGSSECVYRVGDPLASEDPACAFEEVHQDVCRGLPTDPEGCTRLCSEGGGIGFLGGCVDPGDFVRGALRRGLAEEARVGANPFRFGVIGSTDSHQALAGGVDEPSWPGHLGDSEDDPAERLDRSAPVLIRGITTSPGGLAVVWAEENSRESIFDALRRREAYATSGTRIVVRLFAGWGLGGGADLCGASDLVEQGYRDGAPMGGVLPAAPDGTTTGPTLVVSAMRDAMGAPLRQVQIVKGWIDAAGQTHERVYDVAGEPDPSASVDLATCEPTGVGADTLCATWTDPDWEPGQHAFYYARVIENPTCRWHRYVCIEEGVDCATLASDDPLAVCCDDAFPSTITERAWTSAVFL